MSKVKNEMNDPAVLNKHLHDMFEGYKELAEEAFELEIIAKDMSDGLNMIFKLLDDNALVVHHPMPLLIGDVILKVHNTMTAYRVFQEKKAKVTMQ